MSLQGVFAAAPDNSRFHVRCAARAVWCAQPWLIAALLLPLPATGQKSAPDQFTPVVVSAPIGNTQPFPGTDGKYHVVYELVVANTKPTPATLKKVEVLDAGGQGHNATTVIASYDGDALVSRVRTLANTPAKSAEIEFNGTRLFLIDLKFDARSQVPDRLMHRFELMGASGPAPTPMAPVELTYTVAPLDLHPQLREIGPPLAGKRWVAINGCCEISGAHRSSGLSANGWIYFGQRFAIDWMRLDEAGRLVHGDPADVHNYECYGVDVLAVANGTVVRVFDALDDQPPGNLPDPKNMTVQNVLGNHVVLDLGGGVYAFYAHIEKGSISVAEGQRVKRGDVLGKLGNSGNTSGPHLHFHLMDGPSPLASNGIPYVIDSFAVAGKIPAEKDPALAASLEGSWSNSLFPSASPRHAEFPLNLDVIDFPETPGKR